MANLDMNFLARPDFLVSTGENGQTITLTLVPTIIHEGDETQSEPLTYYATGIGKIPIPTLSNYMELENIVISSWTTGNNKEFGVAGVSPSVTDNNPNFNMLDEYSPIAVGIVNFFDFLSKNPVHVKAMNIRATDENMLPQQIIISTPNVFTGQSDRQIIDISSRKTAYQYQNGIITIPDCDFYLCRNSMIDFNASFKVQIDVAESEFMYILNQTKPVYLDLVIDNYLSLEKALVENLKLM